MVAKNCTDSMDTFQQRIDRLNKENDKGTDVYTVEELGAMQGKHDDAVKLFDAINEGG